MIKLNPTKISWFTDILLLILTVGSFFAIFLGGHYLITPDEGRYGELIREMITSGNYLTPHLNGIVFLDKPILFYWLGSGVVKLFGVNVWSLRLAPMLVGLFGCLYTYIAGRKLYNRRTGIIAAAILATSPLYYALTHYVNMDLEVAVFISCSLFSFLIALQEFSNWRNIIWLWVGFIFAALAFLTKGLIGAVFPGLIVGAWILIKNKWRLLIKPSFIAGIFIFIIIVAPWYILEAISVPGFLHYFFITQQVTRFLGQSFNCQQPFFFYILVVLVGLLPWSVFLPQTLHIKKYTARELFLFLWWIIILVFFSIPKSKLVGYIAPVLPPLALLISHYLDTNWKTIKTKATQASIVGWIIITFIGSIVVILMPHYYINLSFFAATILFLGGGAGWLFIRRNNTQNFIIALIVSMVLFVIVAGFIVKQIPLETTEPLVKQLVTYLQPQDKVVTYLDYYQDLPVYLNRKVYIAITWPKLKNYQSDNWKKLFLIGTQFSGSETERLIDLTQFSKLWRNSHRLFVITDLGALAKLKQQTGGNMKILARYRNLILVGKSFP